MNQTVSARNAAITCPACGQEGQRITCSAGSKSEVVVYHPKKKFHTTCRVAGTMQFRNDGDETVINDEQHETQGATAG